MPDLPDVDDRIRQLCADAVLAQEPELSQILAELRRALHEHSTGVREITRAMIKRIETVYRNRRSA
jgi:hypothetical protein